MLKLFKRPALHVVFILAILILALRAWRHKNSEIYFGAKAWLLVGIVVSQLAHVMLIARQPNAMYMIPSFILIPLAIILVWHLGQEFIPKNLGGIVAALFLVLIITQGSAIIRLGLAQAEKSKVARSIDMSLFKSCAKIYSYSASSPFYALLLADFVTKGRMANKLAMQSTDHVFWLEHWWDQSRIVLRNWHGPVEISGVISKYPCLAIRASHWYILERLIPSIRPKITFDELCLTGDETLAVKGVDCAGRIKNK